MVSPAGNYKLYDYQALSTEQVDLIDAFSGYPEHIKLSRMLDQSRATGHIGSAKLAMPDQPLDGEEVTIGSDTYMFLDAESTTLDDSAKIAVLIGASAAATRANFIAAINATDADNVHDSLYIGGDEDAPALANGTSFVFADESGTSVRIRNADAAGGNVIVGTQNLTLSTNITAVADVWNQLNLNATGRSTSPITAHGMVTLSSVTIDTDFNIELPFTPIQIFWQTLDSAYAATTSAVTLTASGTSILVASNGSGLLEGDILMWQAIGL